MTIPKPLVLPRSERLILARCDDRLGYPLELGVTISHTARAFQVYDVYHGTYHETRNDTADVFYTGDAQEALTVYNAILLGDV